MHKLWHLHPAVRTGDQLSLGERAADALKAAFGTWSLLGLIVAGIFAWMMFVTDPGELHLNLALSFLASVQGVILQIAANRGDRISAEVALHTSQNTEALLAMQKQELQILGRIDHMNAELNIIREHVAPGIPNPEEGVDDGGRSCEPAADVDQPGTDRTAAVHGGDPGRPGQGDHAHGAGGHPQRAG